MLPTATEKVPVSIVNAKYRDFMTVTL